MSMYLIVVDAPHLSVLCMFRSPFMCVVCVSLMPEKIGECTCVMTLRFSPCFASRCAFFEVLTRFRHKILCQNYRRRDWEEKKLGKLQKQGFQERERENDVLYCRNNYWTKIFNPPHHHSTHTLATFTPALLKSFRAGCFFSVHDQLVLVLGFISVRSGVF